MICSKECLQVGFWLKIQMFETTTTATMKKSQVLDSLSLNQLSQAVSNLFSLLGAHCEPVASVSKAQRIGVSNKVLNLAETPKARTCGACLENS